MKKMAHAAGIDLFPKFNIHELDQVKLINLWINTIYKNLKFKNTKCTCINRKILAYQFFENLNQNINCQIFRIYKII